MKGQQMASREAVRYVITEVIPNDPGRSFDGGDYFYGRTEYRDYWTGELIATVQWTSADFQYCPIGSGFNCSCPDEEHEQLWAMIDPLDIVLTVYYNDGDLDEAGLGLYGVDKHLYFLAKA
jgi:hypothetical protein